MCYSVFINNVMKCLDAVEVEIRATAQQLVWIQFSSHQGDRL